MTHYFLDSSALVKRYVVEQGTHWVRQITAPAVGSAVFIAHITPVEVVSGLSRRRREGHLTLRHLQLIRVLLNHHVVNDYAVIGLSHRVNEEAITLLENYPLRAYDAVQLASAIVGNERLLQAQLAPLIFVAADDRLLEVAKQVGFNTENPNRHS